jgi:hypothetical protein
MQARAPMTRVESDCGIHFATPIDEGETPVAADCEVSASAPVLVSIDSAVMLFAL